MRLAVHAIRAAAGALKALSNSNSKAAVLFREWRWLDNEVLHVARDAQSTTFNMPLRELYKLAIVTQNFASKFRNRTLIERCLHADADRSVWFELDELLQNAKSRLISRS